MKTQCGKLFNRGIISGLSGPTTRSGGVLKGKRTKGSLSRDDLVG